MSNKEKVSRIAEIDDHIKRNFEILKVNTTLAVFNTTHYVLRYSHLHDTD